MSLRRFEFLISAGFSAVVLSILLPNANAQNKPQFACYTPKTDKINGSCLESSCADFCAVAPRSPIVARGGANTVIPGFFVGERHGRYVVKSVAPGSSAEAGGLLVNDEVVAIDAAKIPLSGPRVVDWASGKAHVVTVKRNQATLSLSVRGDGMRDLVAGLVIGSRLQPVSVGGGDVPALPSTLYVSGLVMRNDGDAKIAGVLAGSPAYVAGLRAGDVITRINGASAIVLSSALRHAVSGSDIREPLTLDVTRGNVTRTVHLTTASLSRVLEQAGAQPGDDPNAPTTLLGYNGPAR